MNITITLVFLFILKHFICDFLLQTSEIAAKKHMAHRMESYFHSGLHLVFDVLCLGALGLQDAWGLAFLGGSLHYAVDWTKGNLQDRLSLGPTDRGFWLLLGADQMIHYLCYVGLSVWAVRICS